MVRRPALLPPLLLGSTVFLWGTSYWPTEIAAGHTSNLMLAALRAGPPALIFLLALPLMRSRLPRGRLAAWALLAGPLMIALFQWGSTEGIARAGPGMAAVLVNTFPLFVLVLGWIFLGERIAPLNVAGLPIGFAGVVLMASSQLGAGDTGRRLSGIALALMAALAWAIGTLLLKWLSSRERDFDMIGFNAGVYVVGGGLLTAIAFAVEGTGGTDWGSGRFWAALVWISPVGALGALFFFLALSRISAARASAVIFLVPALAVIVDVIRGRPPTGLVLAGMVLAVGGVALVVAPEVLLTRLVPLPQRAPR